MIERIDHVVLTVRDLQVTTEFYSRVLQMQTITTEQGRSALQFGQQKINLHEAGSEFEPKSLYPTPGAADWCFVVTWPIDAVIAHLQQQQVAIIEGPVRRIGALGPMISVYFRDMDGNLLELSSYQS